MAQPETTPAPAEPARSGRLGPRPGRSLLAWALANPLGWIGVVFAMLVYNGTRAEPNAVLSGKLALMAMMVIGCVVSYPLTLVFGLPVQAWLVRRGKTSLVANLAAAMLIGLPIGLAVAAFNAGASTSQGNYQPLLMSCAFAVLFLIFGTVANWLIRRPDR